MTKYEGTRLGQQELLAELLEVSEGVWFASFDPARHVSESAEYDPALPVHLAIDCGVSRHVAAVWFQVRRGRVPVQRTALGLDRADRSQRAGDGDGLRRSARRGPLFRSGGARRSWPAARNCPAGAGWTRSAWTRRARPGRGSARRRTPSSNGSSARDPWAGGRVTGCSTGWTRSRSCSIGLAC